MRSQVICYVWKNKTGVVIARTKSETRPSFGRSIRLGGWVINSALGDLGGRSGLPYMVLGGQSGLPYFTKPSSGWASWRRLLSDGYDKTHRAMGSEERVLLPSRALNHLRTAWWRVGMSRDGVQLSHEWQAVKKEYFTDKSFKYWNYLFYAVNL